MLEAIVQSHDPLSKFLSAFRDAFKNRPQYRHFQVYVVGLLIYLGSRNLAGLSRAIPDGRNPCSLYRFVAKMDWDMHHVERVRWEMLNRRTRRALQAAAGHGKSVPVFLAIDDSLVDKTGKTCPERFADYVAAGGDPSKPWGSFGEGKGAYVPCPLDRRPWDEALQSVIELARQGLADGLHLDFEPYGAYGFDDVGEMLFKIISFRLLY